MRIDNQALLLNKMETGINLFLGSGFSVLPWNGASLPLSGPLCHEICQEFNLNDDGDEDLATLSTMLPDAPYQNFLRHRFTVDGCDPLYGCLNNVSINSIITTNIDNIPYIFIKSGGRYYLHDVAMCGAPKASASAVRYFPLHGSVVNPASRLLFTQVDLDLAGRANQELFDLAFACLMEKPTLFWGYGFNESSVRSKIALAMKMGAQDIWVQCLEEKANAIRLLRNMGCNVVIAETGELLRWVRDNVKARAIPGFTAGGPAGILKKYFIPRVDHAMARTMPEDYFVEGRTEWYPVLTHLPYETSKVSEVYDRALREDVIVVGGEFSGKRTLLMQLADKVDCLRKLYVRGPISRHEASLIVSALGHEDAWVFYQDGALDAGSLIAFLSAPNIHLVATTDEYNEPSFLDHWTRETQPGYNGG